MTERNQKSPPSRSDAARWSFGLSVLALACAMIRNIVLVPVYLIYIPVDLYGAWLATGAGLAALLVSDFGLTGVVAQRVAKAFGAGDERAAGRAVGAGLVAGGALALVLSLSALLLSPWVGGVMGFAGESAAVLVRSFVWVAVANGVALLAMTCGVVLRSLQRPRIPGTAEVGAEIAALVVTFALLKSEVGLLALPLGLVVRSGILLSCNGLGLWCLTRRLPELRRGVQFSFASCRGWWRDSSYQCASSLALRLQVAAQPFLVGVLVGPTAAAVYGVTQTAIATANLLIGRLGGAFLPGFTHLFGSGDARRCRRILRQFLAASIMAGALVMGGIVAFNGWFVGIWVGPELYGGGFLTLLLAGAAFADAVMGASYSAVYAGGRFDALARSMVGGAVLQVVCAALLLPLGLWGAGVAVCVAALARLFWLHRAAVDVLQHRLGDAADLRRAVTHLLLPGLGLGLGIAAVGLPRVAGFVPFASAVGIFVSVGCLILWLLNRRLIGGLRKVVAGSAG